MRHRIYPRSARAIAAGAGEARPVDLLKPFRALRYYAPGQNGSASIKAVLPALTGRSYDHLAIQERGTASLEFLRAHFTEVPVAERQRVRRQLEEYCGHDTEGMTWIVEALRRQIGKRSAPPADQGVSKTVPN